MDLFTPLRIRQLEFRNRIVVSPMMQYSTPDGVAGPWHLVHLGSRAVGGAALVIAEQTAVMPTGRSTLYDLGLWNDTQREALRPIASFVREQGAIAGIQLGHAGRKGSLHRPWESREPLRAAEGGWEVVSASALSHEARGVVPRPLEKGEIVAIETAFAKAAQRAYEAGFRYVELHAGHGYLLHQFLSPISNHRTDEYGGSASNRWRMIEETVQKVRGVLPDDCVLAVRLSAEDRVPGGQTIQDTISGAQQLASLGVDMVDLSAMGGVGPGAPSGAETFYPELPQAFRRETGIVTATVGFVREPEEANRIVQEGVADLVVLARAMLRDPYWPSHAAKALGKPIPYPVQYARAWA